MRTIVVHIPKGGYTKTTTSVNLAAGLALEEHYANPANPRRVLFITTDPQCDGTAIVSGRMWHNPALPITEYAPYAKTLSNILVDDIPPSPNEVIYTGMIPRLLERSNLDYIPVEKGALSETRIVLAKKGGKNKDVFLRKDVLFNLRDYLNTIQHLYAYCVIDTSADTDLLTISSFVAADYYICPVIPEGSCFRWLNEADSSYRKVVELLNKNLALLGYLPTKRTQSATAVNVLNSLRSKYNKLVFEPIRERQDLSTSISQGLDIFSFRPPANRTLGYISANESAEDYSVFVKAVIARIEHNGGVVGLPENG
jgi:chromosome partitioning protein